MSTIDIIDAATHNLQHITISLPRRQLIAVSGVSGSGKSSFIFDTLFREGQRRYMEVLSPRARRLVAAGGRSRVRAVRGIAPPVAVEQRHSGYSPGASLAEVAEVDPLLRLWYARLAVPHCPSCGKPLQAESAEEMVQTVRGRAGGALVRLFAPYPGAAGQWRRAWEVYRKRGFLKARLGDAEFYLEDDPPAKAEGRRFAIFIDAVESDDRGLAQLRESLHLALQEGEGRALVRCGEEEWFFSAVLHCRECSLTVAPPTAETFSRRSSASACPGCDGRGVDGAGEECRACGGSGLGERARAFRFRGLNLGDLYAMEITDLLWFFQEQPPTAAEAPLVRHVRPELLARLEAFNELGLGYLRLDRAVPTLSGGELQRGRLVAHLGGKLSGVMYILDEPSLGLHPVEQARLLGVLRRLQGHGATVVVSEHDEATLRAADFLVDLGPGAGERGGRVVYAGPPAGIHDAADSLTGDYLAGRRAIPAAGSRRSVGEAMLEIDGLSRHTLRDVDVRLPLGALTVVCGVSGSGKSSLAEGLHAALRRELDPAAVASNGVQWRAVRLSRPLRGLTRVDQQPAGRQRRSCPATYLGLLPHLRRLFAALPAAAVRGYGPARFSFNLPGGRCEACQGLGVKEIEMGFLPALEVQCPVCGGRRFHSEVLQIRYRGASVADVLEMTATAAGAHFAAVPEIAAPLRAMHAVGLDYLRLGQPLPTLSGGEAQRLKLLREITGRSPAGRVYILDEPTVGLHFEDVARLLTLLAALRDAGATVLVIEHHLDVIAAADHLIELGPSGGRAGGRILYQGPPAGLIEVEASRTAPFIKEKMSHVVAHPDRQ